MPPIYFTALARKMGEAWGCNQLTGYDLLMRWHELAKENAARSGRALGADSFAHAVHYQVMLGVDANPSFLQKMKDARDATSCTNSERAAWNAGIAYVSTRQRMRFAEL